MLKRKERSNSRFFHSQMQCRSVIVRLRGNLILSPRSLYFFSTDQLYHSRYKNIFVDSTTNACLILLRDPWAIKGGLILEDSFPECSLSANCGDKRGRGEGKCSIFEERCLIFTRAIHIETWLSNFTTLLYIITIYIYTSLLSRLGQSFRGIILQMVGNRRSISSDSEFIEFLRQSEGEKEISLRNISLRHKGKNLLERFSLERNSTISKRLNCCSTGLQFLFNSLDDYTLRK